MRIYPVGPALLRRPNIASFLHPGSAVGAISTGDRQGHEWKMVLSANLAPMARYNSAIRSGPIIWAVITASA
jgi:hypothetical protein